MPKNGMYLSRQDFEQWQDQMTKYINSYETLMGIENKPEIRVKNITFVNTEKCNLDCSYCYETHKSNRSMTKEVAKRAVDFIFDKERVNGYYDTNISQAVILEFIGGEPLLEIEIMDYIVDRFKFKAFELNHPWATNYMISFTSNGVLYKDQRVQNFLKKNKGKVSVSITIDGNKELHDKCRKFHNGRGSYDIVEAAIKDAVKNHLTTQTKITLSPENVMYLSEALKNVWSLGLVGVNTNCVFEEGWTIEHAKILYKEMIKVADYLLTDKNYEKYYCSLFDESIGQALKEDKNWCGGNGEMLAIGTDGKCYPCIRFMKYSLSTSGREEKSIGDIYKGLNKKEQDPWLLKLKDITMSSQSSDKCNNCPIASGCSLCTGFNYDKFGDPNKRATYICDMHHARVKSNAYYWNKLYKELKIDKEFIDNVPKEWGESIEL